MVLPFLPLAATLAAPAVTSALGGTVAAAGAGGLGAFLGSEAFKNGVSGLSAVGSMLPKEQQQRPIAPAVAPDRPQNQLSGLLTQLAQGGPLEGAGMGASISELLRRSR